MNFVSTINFIAWLMSDIKFKAIWISSLFHDDLSRNIAIYWTNNNIAPIYQFLISKHGEKMKKKIFFYSLDIKLF